MKISLRLTILSAALASSIAFVPVAVPRSYSVQLSSTTSMAESGIPPATSESTTTEDVEIPTNLPSECGMDYVPLATMLATGQLAEADQVSHHRGDDECFNAESVCCVVLARSYVI